MIINLKTTLLASASVAAALTAGQFLAAYQQREAALSPVWSAVAEAQAGSSPAAAVKLAAVADAPAPAAEPATTPSPSPSPAADPAVAIAARLTAAGLNPVYAGLYLSTQHQTGTPWQLLAAVHQVETNQSGSTNRTSSAGAVGPMQFLPATFARYGVDGDGDGRADITNLDDAVLSAGRYLAASGAATGNYSTALYTYNHSGSYVSRVLFLADRLGL